MNFAPYQSSPPESTRALSPPLRSPTTSPKPQQVKPQQSNLSAATTPSTEDPWAAARAQRLPSPSQYADDDEDDFNPGGYTDLERGEPHAMLQLMRTLGAERSQRGVAVMDVVVGLDTGFQAVSDDFAIHFADDMQSRLDWEHMRSRIAYAGAAALADAYLAAREAVVQAQARELVGGYAVIDVRSKAEAIEHARRLMQIHADHWPGFSGSCELRQLADADAAPSPS